MVDPVRAAVDEVDHAAVPGVVRCVSESGELAAATIGDQDAALRALLALSMKMAAVDDETEIVRLASMAVPSLGGHCRTAAVRLALGRDPQWAGWALAGVGVAWLVGEMRR